MWSNVSNNSELSWLGNHGTPSCGGHWAFLLKQAAKPSAVRLKKRGRVKTPNIKNKKLVVRSCVDVQRVFVFLRKRAL